MVYLYTPPRYKRPQIYLEEPRHLTIPSVISHYKPKPSATVKIFKTPRSWTPHTRKNENMKPKRNTFCQWYKRRKTLNELKSDYKKDMKRRQEERREEARCDRENEFIEQLRLQAAYTAPIEKHGTPIQQYRIEKIEPKLYIKKEKTKRVKTRSAFARPKSHTKSVAVKRYDRYNSLSNRFANFCYRICCQFYCYLTCIIILGFVIFYFF